MKTAVVIKNRKSKVLYFSYKQNLYKIYMHIYIYKRKTKNISYMFLVNQAVLKYLLGLFGDLVKNNERKVVKERKEG